MSRLPPPDGPCVHCLVDGPRTWDHLLPEAWYPDSPEETAKWVVPACQPCNAEYGRIERETLLKLGLGVEPWVVGGDGIGDKAFRAMNPGAARNEKDRKHRGARLEKFRREYEEIDAGDFSEVVFPNIGTIGPPNERGKFMRSTIEWSDIEKIIIKFIRGLVYLRYGEPLPAEYEAKAGDPRAYNKLNEHLKPYTPVVFDRAPGFYVEVYYTDTDKYASIMRFYLWSKYELMGSIMKKTGSADSGREG